MTTGYESGYFNFWCQLCGHTHVNNSVCPSSTPTTGAES